MAEVDRRLNVIFHGMFAFIVWGDRIEVLCPQEEDHIYKAGAWGRERRLREESLYQLRGVVHHTKKPELDSRQNLVLHGLTEIKRSSDLLFCSISLPFPERICGMRRVTVNPLRRLFGGEASPTVNPESLPLVQVLTYVVDDPSTLELQPAHNWEPEFGTDSTVNLHVWAESDSMFTEAERDHPIRGFQQLTGLFPGLDLQLLYSTGAPMDQISAVPGVAIWEQATLRERSRFQFAGPGLVSKGAEVTNCLSLFVDNG